MNNLSLKLLRCLNKQNNNYGFTLIELLVVIIIIGILSAIASSSFLNIVRKAKEAEPTLKINGANKIQTNYYSENGEFSRDIADLELPDETKNYVYYVPDKISFFPIPPDLSIILGIPKDEQLRYFVGVIYIKNDATYYQRLCKVYEDEYLFLFFMLIQEKWDEVDAKYCSSQ
ncbi:MAG: prepilin-type N-terminal cleavage/methylation domain-containing protein [Trichodesmium sp. St17_bin3_1_1]|nr:prepilin-type N-terminal cleavage/methylation domain-containing protein [Trichodesmium sp. St17_bin3_1_1]